MCRICPERAGDCRQQRVRNLRLRCSYSNTGGFHQLRTSSKLIERAMYPCCGEPAQRLRLQLKSGIFVHVLLIQFAERHRLVLCIFGYRTAMRECGTACDSIIVINANCHHLDYWRRQQSDERDRNHCRSSSPWPHRRPDRRHCHRCCPWRPCPTCTDYLWMLTTSQEAL
jgi:hypothetical protein